MRLHFRFKKYLRTIAAAACAIGCSAGFAQTTQNAQLVLKGVSVVDTRTGGVKPGMNVVISGG